MAELRSIQVRYFAALREQRGLSEERVETIAATPRDLYAELRSRHGLALGPDMLNVAVNDDVSDWGAALKEGDTVVFLPPVAGG